MSKEELFEMIKEKKVDVHLRVGVVGHALPCRDIMTEEYGCFDLDIDYDDNLFCKNDNRFDVVAVYTEEVKKRFEVFGDDVKDNEQMPHLLNKHQATVRLNEFAEKIADLEAKLAESEEYIKMLLEVKGIYIDLVNGYSEKCKNYEQQLAESARRNEQLVKALNGEVFINYKVPMENAKLKQQLAENEKEIEDRMMAFEKRCQEYYKSNEYKIDFAVEQLNFLKNEIEIIGHIPNYTVLPERELICRFDVLSLIENQIKQLKEGK